MRNSSSAWIVDILTEHGASTSSGVFPMNPEQYLEIYRNIGYTSFVPAHRYATHFRSSGPTAANDLTVRIDQEIDLIAQARPSISKHQTRESLRAAILAAKDSDDIELRRRAQLMFTGALLISDEFLKQKIIDLDYASHRLKKPSMRTLIDKIMLITTDVTEGFPVEFVRIADDAQGLYPEVRTADGDMPIDSLSQGTMSIIHCIAYILIGYAEYYNFPEDLEDRPGIVMIDEIDAHLHPSWQRRFIPALTEHFPNLQLFCSTHSPLMLAGLGAGQVQLLTRPGNESVAVSANASDIAGWTADEILRHLLSLSSSTDLVTERHVDRLRELRSRPLLSDAEATELEVLRESVAGKLVSDPMEAEIARLTNVLQSLDSSTDDSSHRASSANDDSSN